MASGNDEQIAYWNSRAGERWAQFQARIDRQFAPLTEALLAKAAIGKNESVLDVGCGSGATTLAAAASVGKEGHVLALDVSQPMLDLARARASDAGLTQIDFALADAAETPFARRYDLLISRFGVMFFADPVAAFGHLRGALAPTGRVCFACWQPLERNPFFAVPMKAVFELAPQEPSDPLAPGPFAFSDPARVQMILGKAGYTNVQTTPHDTTMVLSGPNDLEGAVEFVTRIGPAARAIAEATREDRPKLLAAVKAALAKYETPAGVGFAGAIWIVTADAS